MAGFFLFLYVYGPASQRYRGTLVAARAWYRSFARPGPAFVVPVSSPARRRWYPNWWGPGWFRSRPVWVFRPVDVPTEVFDREVYSLESAFPAATDEPFQEYNHEYFDEQQDLDTFQDDEPHNEVDVLWGTHPGVWLDEEDGAFSRDRFARLTRREYLHREEYYFLDEPVDGWYPRGGPRAGGLARLVTPGDGPSVEDDEDYDHEPGEWDDYLVDWYHYQTQPTRITQTTPPDGPAKHLFLDRDYKWRPDPTGRPAGWGRLARGLLPWLYRTRRRRWGRVRWQLQRYYNGVQRRAHPTGRTWQTRRTRRRLARPDAGRDRRWDRPGLVELDETPDLFGGPPDPRGAVRRVRRFAARARRWITPGGAPVWARRARPAGLPERVEGRRWWWRQMRQPDPVRHRGGRFARVSSAEGRSRPRYAAWHAPAYAPVYDRVRTLATSLPGGSRGLPPTGVELTGWLFAGGVAGGAAVAVALAGWSFFERIGTDPWAFFDGLGPVVDSPWRADFFRRVLEDLPTGSEVYREHTPRERVTTRKYSLWTTPVGRHWKDNPGVDSQWLLLHSYARANRPILHYDTWWLGDLNEQIMMMTKRISVDRRGIFLWHAGWRLPSWVHMDDRVGDEWVNDPMFRLWHGQLEPLTIRRELDHRYNLYRGLGWMIEDEFVEGEYEGNVDELLHLFWNYFRGVGIHSMLGLPEWIGRADRKFHLDFAGYWAVLFQVAAWPSAAHLDFWCAPYDLAVTDEYHRFHTGAVAHSVDHHLLGVSTRWEPFLNGRLVASWDRPAVFPYGSPGWYPDRVVRWFADSVVPANWPVDPLVGPVRAWFYFGGLVWWFVFRGDHLDGLTRPGALATTPVGRRCGSPPGRPTRRATRRYRSPHREKPRSEWTRISPVRLGWRWSREGYWASLRRGRHTEVIPPGRPPRWVAPPGRAYRPGGAHPPSRPGPVAGLLYQTNRISVGSGPARSTGWVAPPGWTPVGWLARPVRPARPAPTEYTPGERPPLYRAGRRGGRHRRPRLHRGGPSAARVGRPPAPDAPVRSTFRGVTHPVGWVYRGHAVGLAQQHAWHFQRYRADLAGTNHLVGPVGPTGPVRLAAFTGLAGVNYPGRTALAGETKVPTGYDAAMINDDEEDDYVAPAQNHHDDMEELEEPRDPTEEYEGTRYLPVVDTVGVVRPGRPGDLFVRHRLVAYRRFAGLPARVYRPGCLTDYFGDHTVTGWSPVAGDHPAWVTTLLTTYGVARWGGRTHRGVLAVGTTTPGGRRRRRRRGRHPGVVNLLWPAGWDALWDELTTTGWVTYEVGDPGEYYFEDDEVTEFGGIPHEGYRPSCRAAYHAGGYRPGDVHAGLVSVWAPPGGWNTHRYLAGEHLGRVSFAVTDPEDVVLAWLTQTYLDYFDVWHQVVDYYAGPEREFGDLHDGEPDEEDDEEVPATRPGDLPAWLVAAAVAGASAGATAEVARADRLNDLHDADPESAEPAGHPTRASLRRYYRTWRRVAPRARRRRPGTGLKVASSWTDQIDRLLDEVALLEDRAVFTATETDNLGPAGAGSLEFEGHTEETLRMWALTEVYWGDQPHGPAAGH